MGKIEDELVEEEGEEAREIRKDEKWETERKERRYKVKEEPSWSKGRAKEEVN